MCLPAERRLKSAQYRQVLDRGRRQVGRLLVMWTLKVESGGAARVGIIASRRSFRRAVDRNRARRLLREAFRKLQPELPSSVDLVLVARTAVRGKGLAEVERELRYLCERTGLGKA